MDFATIRSEDRVMPPSDMPLHGVLLEQARGTTSKRAAARLAGISEGRWRQIVTGVQKVGGGREIPVNPKRETLVSMAMAVGADVDEVLAAAGMESREPGESAAVPEVVRRLSDKELLDEIARRLHRPAPSYKQPVEIFGDALGDLDDVKPATPISKKAKMMEQGLPAAEAARDNGGDEK